MVARSAMAGVAVLALAACDNPAKAPTSGTIAEVAGTSVTAGELDRELTLAGVPADKRGEDQVRLALRDIVTRKFLAARAHEALLENDPTVAGDIARTREQILSAALSQRELKEKALALKPADIDAYIAAHARAFDKRVVYAVDQILVPMIPDVAQYVVLTKDAKTLEEIEPKLDAMRVPRNRSRSELDGGAITDAFALALAGQVSDSVYFARRDPNGVFFKVLAVDPRPIVGPEAQAKAQQALQGEWLAKIAQADAAAALAGAKFSGDYARIMAGLKPTQ